MHAKQRSRACSLAGTPTVSTIKSCERAESRSQEANASLPEVRGDMTDASSIASIALEYRLGEGGLLRRVEAACRLTRLRTQVFWTVALTWAPIVALSVLHEQRTGFREMLLYDPALHVRLLVAVPMFLLLDQIFPTVCRQVLELLMRQAFIPKDAEERFQRTLSRATRLADSNLPEGVFALFGAAIGVATLLEVIPVIGLKYRGELTPAQTWYALADVPLFQFLLWRSLWRWFIWTGILSRLSRLPLKLVPTHPDRCGGIAFLRFPSVDYCTMLLFAVASVLSAEWGSRLSFEATLNGFKPLLLVFATLATLIAFGPLLLFMPLLFRARRSGTLDAAEIAVHTGRRFEQRWLEGRGGRGRSLSNEAQGLAALITSYRETVDQMRVLLFDKGDLIKLLVATLVPVLPVMIVHVPWQDWRGVLGLLTGGFIR